MAETPNTAATPAGQPEENPGTPAEAAGTPAAEAAENAAETVEQTVVAETVAVEAVVVETATEAVVGESATEAVVDEEPEVEGWSGSPSAASAPEAIARPVEPSIAATLEVPPLPATSPSTGAKAGEGGEFDLLIGKVNAWFDELDLAGRWQKLRGPLRGVAVLLALLLALRLYAQVVGTIDRIPVISGLLELTGLIYVLWFTSTRLVRTSERERVLADWKQRWQSFSGRD
ncbi:MAG: CAAD domain-containing protein [Cyanobium sp.]